MSRDLKSISKTTARNEREETIHLQIEYRPEIMLEALSQQVLRIPTQRAIEIGHEARKRPSALGAEEGRAHKDSEYLSVLGHHCRVVGHFEAVDPTWREGL